MADAILPLDAIGKFVYGLWVNPAAKPPLGTGGRVTEMHA